MDALKLGDRGTARNVPGGRMESAEFRRIMGRFVTGVAVVTSREPDTGEPCGLTANATTSVSLEPPLVLVCIDRAADSHDCIVESGVFALNILARQQEPLARRFGVLHGKRKFEGVAYRAESTGAPVLDATVGWVDCRVWATYPGGDHTIVVGEVVSGAVDDRPPLVYHRGGYARLAP